MIVLIDVSVGDFVLSSSSEKSTLSGLNTLSSAETVVQLSSQGLGIWINIAWVWSYPWNESKTTFGDQTCLVGCAHCCLVSSLLIGDRSCQTFVPRLLRGQPKLTCTKQVSPIFKQTIDHWTISSAIDNQGSKCLCFLWRRNWFIGRANTVDTDSLDETTYWDSSWIS